MGWLRRWHTDVPGRSLHALIGFPVTSQRMVTLLKVSNSMYCMIMTTSAGDVLRSAILIGCVVA